MPRIRTIKPEFQQSQSMGRISRDARLVFILLWPQCDDSGRVRGSLTLLSSILLPYDADASLHMEKWVSELEREDCIQRYVSNGDDYIQIVNWHHQKIEKPSKSRLPDPPQRAVPDHSPIIPRIVGEPSPLDQGSGIKESIKDFSVTSVTAVPASEEPRQIGKPDWWPKRDRYGRVVTDITDKLLFDLGKAVLGSSAGGQITRLKKCYRGDLRACADIVLQADDKSNSREWFAGVLKRAELDELEPTKHEKYPDKIYTDGGIPRAPPPQSQGEIVLFPK